MATNYSALGLQQDPQGQFSPIPGFGIGATPSSEEIAGMNWNQRMGMMTSQMGQAQTQAQQANLGLLSQQLNEVGNLGAAGRQQITDVYGQERARTTQSLAARGLGSTTVSDAASAGIAGREQRARTGLEESLTQQRLGVLNAANFQQPDMGGFYGQMMSAGAAGLGQKPPKQQEWWKGPVLGAGLNWLTGSGGGGGGGGGGGALSGLLGGLTGKQGGFSGQDLGNMAGQGIRKLFSGGGDLSNHPAYAPGTGLFGQPVNAEILNPDGGGWQAAGTTFRGQSPELGYGVPGGPQGPPVPGSGGIAQQIGGMAMKGGAALKTGASALGGKLMGLGSLAKGGLASMFAGPVGGAVLAAAPWLAAAAGGYMVYKNNKEKIDNLYDDAEEDVKRHTKRQFKSIKKTWRNPKRLLKKRKKIFKKLKFW